jgi:hypothetical protein
VNIYVIYSMPRDFPEHVVVRRWVLSHPTDDMSLHPNLEDARRHLLDEHPDLFKLSRNPGDDPTIVETWL